MEENKYKGYEFARVDFDSMSDEELKKRTKKALEDWASGKYGPCDDGEEIIEDRDVNATSIFERYKKFKE